MVNHLLDILTYYMEHILYIFRVTPPRRQLTILTFIAGIILVTIVPFFLSAMIIIILSLTSAINLGKLLWYILAII